jgi:hypothetical protein
MTPASDQNAFRANVADLSIDEIDLAGGIYTWQYVVITTDRTSRPLTIGCVAGATVDFVGPATSEGIIFQFGSSESAQGPAPKAITVDGAGCTFRFRDFALASSGAIEVRGSDRLTFKNLIFSNLRRDPAHAPAPRHSWLFYISGGWTGTNDNLIIDHITALAPAVSRDISGIQLDSSGSNGNITVTASSFTNYDYVFFDARPTTNLFVDGLTISNSGDPGGPSSIRINGPFSIAGKVQNCTALMSSRFLDDHTGGGVVTTSGLSGL